MVSICKDRGQEFLSLLEYKRHQQTHLQTHLDEWSRPDKVSSKRVILVDGQLNTAIREPSRILELQDRQGMVAGIMMARS